MISFLVNVLNLNFERFSNMGLQRNVLVGDVFRLSNENGRPYCLVTICRVRSCITQPRGVEVYVSWPTRGRVFIELKGNLAIERPINTLISVDRIQGDHVYITIDAPPEIEITRCPKQMNTAGLV